MPFLPPLFLLALLGSVHSHGPDSCNGYHHLPDNTYQLRSPPFYPSPNSRGLGWKAAHSKARAFVSQPTLKEKADVVTGRYTGVL